MRQYLEAKRQYPHALVFFRMGDFYEMFYEDALVASRALDLTLTSRSKDATGVAVPMCGVPYHAADGYITRLVRKGHRVAICEQVEDPRKAKGVVKRDVVRVVSPGTLTDASYLDAREPAFLMAVLAVRRVHRCAGSARCSGRDLRRRPLDLSTGEFEVAEYQGAHALPALRRGSRVVRPREIVAATGFDVATRDSRDYPIAASVTAIDGWNFEPNPRARRCSNSCASAASKDSGWNAARPRWGGRRAGAVPARHAKGRARARAHAAAASTADRLLIDPTTLQASRGRRVRRRRPRGIAAGRDRPHGDADGRPAAARLAARAR